MPAASEQDLEMIIIANDAYRTAMLQKAIWATGLKCEFRRLTRSKKALAYLAKEKTDRQSPRSAVVLFDFADVNTHAMKFAARLAFGPQRSKVPVIFLTNADTEPVLTRGDVDGGQATMFSPRSLGSILQKLADDRRPGFLKALETLYQYGPVLAREPRQFQEQKET